MDASLLDESEAMSWVLPAVDPFLLVSPYPEPPLAGWYATPLVPAVAAQLLAQARQAQQRQLSEQGSQFAARLAELIACYWQARAITLDYQSLLATAASDQQALVELVYGQLLISRKLSTARAHLKRGFTLATPRFKPAEYFSVLRCHEMLDWLLLTEHAAVPQGLPDLLSEARVIKRLQPARKGTPTRYGEDDTLG